MLDTIRELCEKHNLAEHADTICSLARPAAAIEMDIQDDDAIPLGASRFGGSPDLPANTNWPRKRSRRMLNFLAQINLSEPAPLLGEQSHIPPDGHLYFFYDVHDAQPCIYAKHFDEFHVMYVGPGVELQKFPRPKPLRDPDPTPIGALASARMKFAQAMTIPHLMYLPPDALPKSTRDDYVEMYSSHQNILGKHWPMHQFGGYPSEEQEGTFVTCASASRCVDQELLGDHPAWYWWLNEARDWRLLLQLDSDDDLKLDWYRAYGRLYFCAARESLLDRSFDLVWMEAQCS